ncbi:MAG: CoF synthetase [Planctomycetota bacterium]
MIDTIHNALQTILVHVLAWLHRRIQSSSWLLKVASKGWVQPILQWSCRMKVLAVHREAARHCPAYRSFLAKNGKGPISRWHEFTAVPVTTKENYVKPYTIESRCYGGVIPTSGVIIDESSGSSGKPSNWVRGREEQRSVSKLLQNAYRQEYAGSKQLIVLNCFSLGVWATGMNVTMSLADIAIIKSIGPDKERLESTLRAFGPDYRYLIAGYPTFLKSFADTTTLDLGDYDAHLVVGGEGMSEGFRTHLLQHYSSVRSSYGASDLEINIGAETAFTIGLRQACSKNTELCHRLFGRTTPPMIFQYNQADYYIETNEEGELLFTIARSANISPKIRYNLRDIGGVMSIKQLESVLADQGIDLADIAPVHSHLPLLYVFGRSDMTLSFYGANIGAADIETVISSDPQWVQDYSSFRLRIDEDKQTAKQTLVITLEMSENNASYLPDTEAITQAFLQRLTALNPDIREAVRLLSPDQFEVEVLDHGTGPFADHNNRQKHQYVLT